MADRPKTTPKKPPAHEVILALLEQLVRMRMKEREGLSVFTSPVAQRMEASGGMLLLALARIGFPEQARASMAAALRALPPDFLREMDAELGNMHISKPYSEREREEIRTMLRELIPDFDRYVQEPLRTGWTVLPSSLTPSGKVM